MTDPIALDARTTRHSLPLLYPGQAQKEIFVNEALARLDALAQPVVLASRSAPPVSHEAGDTFLIVGPASDPWSGREDSLAISQGTHWMYQARFRGCGSMTENGPRSGSGATAGARRNRSRTPPEGRRSMPKRVALLQHFCSVFAASASSPRIEGT